MRKRYFKTFLEHAFFKFGEVFKGIGFCIKSLKKALPQGEFFFSLLTVDHIGYQKIQKFMLISKM
jgi:hypothetical protein